jgi:hypothetical protein
MWVQWAARTILVSVLVMKAELKCQRSVNDIEEIYTELRFTRIERQACDTPAMNSTLSDGHAQSHSSKLRHLARCTSRDIQALGALLTSSNAVASPCPARASTLSTKNVHIRAFGRNSSRDILDRQTGDRHTSSRCASRATVLVILLNHNAVFCDVRELNVLVRDAADRPSCTIDGLDAHAVVRVGDARIEDAYVLDGVVGAAAYGANRDTVTSNAGATGKGDI